MAGDALVLRYRDRLFRYVLIRSGARRRHSLDVEDVIHDAYVKDSLYAYLRSIADRLVLDRWRTAGERRRESGESAERIIEELLSRDPDPSDSEDARELEELLDACVAELSAKHREVILNRYYLGGSAREVAEWLGYSNAHAVETLCGRAKAKLIRIAAARLGRRLESA
jgi:RNA polymerase sigma factor (sigma-70 family)